MSTEHDVDSDLSSLRTRLAADVAAGRTVVLSKTELASPRVRERLPQLLDGLAPAEPPRGQLHVPGYTLLGEIGRGGMSTVHLARHDALGRHVALKVAQRQSTDVRTQQRLLGEARAMARVSHPHVVAIHDVVEIGEGVAIAMEWVDGLTLAGLLMELPQRATADDMALVAQRLGTPAAKVAKLEKSTTRFFVQMLHDIARAAHAAHTAGLLHLDIKPSNILIRRDGTALLADFGVVREMDLVATHTLTFAGTPIYASPEQLRRADDSFCAATDVYALGVTLYEALARRQPLANLDLKALVETVAGGRMPHLTQWLDVAPDLATIVHKAIAPEIEQRYPSAAAFADDLQAFLEGRPIQGKPMPRLLRVRRWARNEPWKAALAGVLMVLLPIALGAVGYLIAMAPRIEESRRQERVAQANTLKQAAYQQVFLSEFENEAAYQSLRDAFALDPSPVSLACWLTILLDQQAPQLAAVLEQHAAMVDASLGLRLIRTKAQADPPRAFFDATEIEQLRASPDRTDSYVLALDRMLHADDHDGSTRLEAALADMAAASLVWPDDPLLFGLQVWLGGRCAQSRQHDAALRTIQLRWPDSFEAEAWVTLSQETADPAFAAQEVRNLHAKHPRHPRAMPMRIGVLFRTAETEFDLEREPPDGPGHQRLAEVVKLCEQAVAGGYARPKVTLLHCLARRKLGAPDAMPFPDEPMHPDLAWKLWTPTNTAALLEHTDKLIAAERPSALQLSMAYTHCTEANATDRLDALWKRWTERFRDRHRLSLRRCQTLYGRHIENQGRAGRRRRANAPGEQPDLLQQIADLARNVGVDFRHDIAGAVVFATAFVQTHDWTALRSHAEEWIRYAPADLVPQAHSYAGMALSRLGDLAAAARHLAIATDAAPRTQTIGWFRAALVEKAWQLTTGSDGDRTTGASNAARAADCFARLDALPNSAGPAGDGRWAHLVRATVLAAQGNPKQALAMAEAARSRFVEPQAPRELPQLLTEAIERWSK